MLDRKTEQKRIYNVTRFKDSLRNIREARPLNTVNPLILGGLFNITTIKSGIINSNTQKELKGVLTGAGTLNWYYIKTETIAEVPRQFKFLYFKGELTKEEPNQIKAFDINGFKFKIYAIQFLKPDSNGFYFIVNIKDVVKFIQMINKANTSTKYQKENTKRDYETLEDITEAYNIKTTTDSENIFKYLDEYERKLLYIYAKKAGVGKQERKLLKRLQKGGQTFNLYLEELEEAIEAEENEQVKEELKKEYTRLTEEDNSWNLFKTTLEDYL